MPVRLESGPLQGWRELAIIQIGAVAGRTIFRIGGSASRRLQFSEANMSAVEEGLRPGGAAQDADCSQRTSQLDRAVRSLQPPHRCSPMPSTSCLTQYRLGIALDELEVDLHAETRSHRRMHQSFAINLYVRDKAILIGRIREKHFEVFAVSDCHGDVQAGHIVERVAAVMDLEIHAESFGDMRRLHTGRDAAFETHVTAQEIGRLTQQPRRVLIEATERQFRSHQWDSQLLTKLL